MPVVLASQFNCAFCRLCKSHAFGFVRLMHNPLIGQIVIAGRATQIHCSNLQQFVLCIHSRNIIRARHRKRGIAPPLCMVPRQMAAGIAPLNHAIFPFTCQHFGGYTRRCSVRKCTEVANARMNVQLALWRQTHQTIITI